MSTTVLVTGTSSGIGEAAVRAFLADGWNVVATARDPAAAAGGMDHPRLLPARLDVTDPESIEAAFQVAEQRFGAVDMVVNNAGIGLGGPLEGISLTQLRDHLEVNVIGVAAVCQIAAAHMRPRGRGLIVNVTSLTGRVGVPFLAPYCAGKFAVEGLTEALYYELRPHGIRVKLVEPGGARTRFSHPWAEHPAYSPAAEAVREKMERGVESAPPADQVAKVILAAAKEPGDRLRHAATSAVPALRMHRLLPESAWRKILSRSFGLNAHR
ncbi:SDR family oxidoreductase [Bradyrhizobium sp. dw_78]|uniref:SDR family oxidoreductase n=1 Tax=Bradyrhizobium sp. dw_78 TaxID=2719793 RepID=UPI001BD5A7C9|nr:SDR family oxidoreductase [Bradyrhizobium sp. dw_78]